MELKRFLLIYSGMYVIFTFCQCIRCVLGVFEAEDEHMVVMTVLCAVVKYSS